VNRHALDELKRQIPLLEYLQTLDWHQARPIGSGRFLGLCPLHEDHKPSFLADPRKNLFYCYGCHRGGDVIRLAELYHQVKFPQAVALLYQWLGSVPMLAAATDFYRLQLQRHGEAVTYLQQRGIRSPELIEYMRVGYAPGGCLCAHLTQLGYSLQVLHQAGLATAAGHDTYAHRIVFPLEGNLYGRSLSGSAPSHRFLPGRKGGLYSWDQVWQYPEVILVETTPHCGRPVFITSLARWAPISTRANFGNSAMAPEPSIWPLTPTRTTAGRKRHGHLPAGSQSTA
jgi:hypothetical protein